MKRHVTETEWWEHCMRDIYGPREGGLIIVIDAENARKGVAKTSCAAYLARLFATQFDYDIEPGDALLSSKNVLRRYADHPGEEKPSVMVWDEAVGAGGGDARRAMSNENIDLGRAWQTLRTKRIVTLTTLPNWNDLDPRLQNLADYRVHVTEWPIGKFRAYKSGTPFSGKGIRLYGMGRDLPPGVAAREIKFPDMNDLGCDFYETLSRKKQALVDSGTFDADEIFSDGADDDDSETLSEWHIQTTRVLEAVKPWTDSDGLTYREAAKKCEFSRGWVSERVQEWRDGEHRMLVPDPRPEAGGQQEVAT